MKIQSIFIIIFLASALTSIIDAQTFVSGGIYANTSWTLANSPYVITDTVVVFPNVTLTIEPGVTVKFYNSKLLEIRNGSLIANGSITDSIRFTSNSSTPIPGIYEGVIISGSLPMSFEYCKFEYANGGFQGYGGLHAINCRHCLFRNNVSAIGPIYDDHSIYDSCYFVNNTYGMLGYASYLSVLSNSIFNSNTNAVNRMENMHIRNCTFLNNSGNAVRTSQGNEVMECLFNNNNVAIWINQSGGGNYITIEQNIIENNTLGIVIEENFFSLDCNRICNNSQYDLKNISISNFVVDNNAWCSNDSATIASHIYDGYDNASYGLITFLPLDTVQCYLTGCNIALFTSATPASCDTCHDGTASVTAANATAPVTYTW